MPQAVYLYVFSIGSIHTGSNYRRDASPRSKLTSQFLKCRLFVKLIYIYCLHIFNKIFYTSMTYYDIILGRNKQLHGDGWR